MAQPRLHAVLALATRKTFSTQRWFALGLVFGALFPDLDGYPQAVATLAGNIDAHQAEAIFHRTLTHSLFFVLFVGIAFYLVSLVRGGLEHSCAGDVWDCAGKLAALHQGAVNRL